MFLTAAEIRELTGRARPKAQIAALERMGIRHRVNEVGRPMVTWKAVDGWYDDQDAPAEPDFSRI